jgi:hypothetical protein
MQMLVYENYNKFISATDTIRKMKVPRRFVSFRGLPNFFDIWCYSLL